MYKWILLSLLVVGCGTGETFIDADLELYVSDYLELTQDYPGNKINSVTIVDFIADGVIGVCRRGTDNLNRPTRDIKITREGTRGIYKQRALVYHEMAHCVHDLGHDETSPILRSNILRDDQYAEMWPEAIAELLEQVSKQIVVGSFQ